MERSRPGVLDIGGVRFLDISPLDRRRTFGPTCAASTRPHRPARRRRSRPLTASPHDGALVRGDQLGAGGAQEDGGPGAPRAPWTADLFHVRRRGGTTELVEPAHE